MMPFEELRALVAHCTKPDGPALYRKLYGMHAGDPSLSISSWEEWRALPVLTKQFLSQLTLPERTFMPLSDIDHLRISSGTSGSKPLFTPRMRERGLEYRLQFHDYRRPLLSFTAPMMPHWHEQFLKSHGLPGRVIVYDPHNPAASVRLAKITGADAISAFTYQLRWIGEHMVREYMNETIRSIDITGERCSRAQLEYIRATFPHATVYETYGASEMHDPDIGIPCGPLTVEHPAARYHPKRTHFLELLDSSTRDILPLTRGVVGDLLISAYAGEPASFPLIRLRLGDSVRIEENQCAAHNQWTFSVVGRTDQDFARVPGGVIAVDEVERIVHQLSDLVTDRFVFHLQEQPSTTGARFAARLEIELRDTADVLSLAHEIERNLRINPHYTWHDGVQDGRFLPLSVTPLTSLPPGKHRRIVRD